MSLALLSTLLLALSGLLFVCLWGVAMVWGARQSPSVRKYLVDLARALRGGR